ncbi:TELO2-interacting protein 1 [Trichonephila clavipes]|nr:TELO2-interacting protein 1 [Trichonephila clavipes]
MLAEFLPGLSIALMSVICGDVKQGEAVVRIALNILAELIVLVVGDSCTIKSEENKCTQKKEDGVIKSETWFKETFANLEIVVGNCTTVVSHDNWKVRLGNF